MLTLMNIVEDFCRKPNGRSSSKHAITMDSEGRLLRRVVHDDPLPVHLSFRVAVLGPEAVLGLRLKLAISRSTCPLVFLLRLSVLHPFF